MISTHTMITYILIHKWGCHSPESCQILIPTAHYNPVLCVDKHNFHNVSWTFLLIYLATETFISWTLFASIIQSIYLSLSFFFLLSLYLSLAFILCSGLLFPRLHFHQMRCEFFNDCPKTFKPSKHEKSLEHRSCRRSPVILKRIVRLTAWDMDLRTRRRDSWRER